MRFLIIIFTLLSCSRVLTNSVDEQRLLCGDGVEAGKDYIKVSNEYNLVVFPHEVPTTSKGCVERPKSGEVLITNAGRTSGAWLNSQSNGQVRLEPLANSQLPTACSSVVHGDGRGFNLNLDLKEDDKKQFLQTIEILLLAKDGSQVATWPAQPLAKLMAFQFDPKRPVLSGEYRLVSAISDRVSGAATKSECTLRIDYSELLISPAESVKTKRNFNEQEVLVVQPGYNVNFYVHEGFRDVSIEYCLKRIPISAVRQTIDPEFLKCETSLDFLSTKSPTLEEGFWVLNYRGQRGLVQNAWQHSVFMVEKVCIGVVSSPEDVENKGCTTIRGSIALGEKFPPDKFSLLESIVTVYGEVKAEYPNQILGAPSLLPNLEEIYGNLLVKANFRKVKLMPSLRNVWGNFKHYLNDDVDLDSEYFPKLTVVSGYFNLLGDEGYENSSVYFPQLSLVEGSVSLSGGYAKELKILPRLQRAGTISLSGFRSLENLEGFQALKSVDTLQLNEMSGLLSLKGFEGVKSLKSLEVTNASKIKDLSDLSISEVEVVVLNDMPALESFSKNRIVVSKNLYISKTPMLKNLKSFGFGSSIEFISLLEGSVQSFEGVEGIESIQYFLTLENLPQVKDFSPFGGLNSLDTLISKNTGLRDISDLKNLRSLTTLTFEGTGNSEINLASLVNISTIEISGCKKIEFGKFDNEATISVLSLANNSFADLKFLPEVSWVLSVSIHDNPALESLRGIENLKAILDSISISKNPKLKDISDLKKLERLGTINSDVQPVSE